jgi:hypothetical protein
MNMKTATRVLAYLLVYLGVPIVAGIISHETVSATLAIIYILVLIPFGILRLIDFYRSNDGTTLPRRVFNVLFRVPLALFGLVCLVAGASIIGWVLYNVLIERQAEYTGPSFIVGLGSFGISVPLLLYGWMTLRSAVRRTETISTRNKPREDLE